MERKELKELLISIRNQDYRTPENINSFDLAVMMMDYIGDTEGEMRDDLVLTTLWDWIVKGVLTIEEVHKILNISLDEEHLFYGIGKKDDSVFTRTFSVLIAAVCFSMNLNDKYLTLEDVDIVYDKVIKYYNEEKDVRGYIDGKGWAHGSAHGADALGELAKCDDIGHDKLMEILKALRNKVSINNYAYINNEDERMVSAVVAVLSRKELGENEIINWIRSFEPLAKIGKYPEDMTLEINVKNFLESLYFRLLESPEYKNIVNTAWNVIKEINSFLRRKKR